jgi:class 3 adenylate cyclase
MGSLSVTSEDTSPSLAAIVAEVDPELTGQRARTSPEGMVTIAFTDIEGSTELLERFGERRWLELIAEHNRIVRDCVFEHEGEVVKSQGDGFMIAFTSTGSAVAFGIGLQRILASRNTGDPVHPLHVRVGMHTGRVFEADEDLLGKTVVLAARITGHARGGQVLISAASHEYIRGVAPWHFRGPIELRLKGIERSEHVYSIRWNN